MSKSQSKALAIAHRIKLGKPFTVQSNNERKIVLDAAKYLEVRLSTRAAPSGGFDVFFLTSTTNQPSTKC